MSRGGGYSIIKRKHGGRELRNYQVRIWVPPHLRSVVGKSEKLLSLGTGDWRAANLAAPGVVARQFAQWNGTSGAGISGEGPIDNSVEIAVRVVFDDMLAALEHRRRSWPADDVG